MFLLVLLGVFWRTRHTVSGSRCPAERTVVLLPGGCYLQNGSQRSPVFEKGEIIEEEWRHKEEKLKVLL